MPTAIVRIAGSVVRFRNGSTATACDPAAANWPSPSPPPQRQGQDTHSNSGKQPAPSKAAHCAAEQVVHVQVQGVGHLSGRAVPFGRRRQSTLDDIDEGRGQVGAKVVQRNMAVVACACRNSSASSAWYG